MSSARDYALDRGPRAAASVPPELYLDPTLHAALPLYCLIRGLGASADTQRGKGDLAEALGWTRSVLFKRARLLERAGWLVREKKSAGSLGSRSTWRVAREDADRVHTRGLPSPHTWTTESTHVDYRVHDGGRPPICTPPHPTTPHTPKSTHVDSVGGEDPEGQSAPPAGSVCVASLSEMKWEDAFAGWWSAYPKREGRRDAERAYRKALRKVSPAELLAGAQRYAKSVAGKNPRWTAKPANWLRGERWLDEAPPEVEGFAEIAEAYPGTQAGHAQEALASCMAATGLSAEQIGRRVREYVEHRTALQRPLVDLADLFDVPRGLLDDANLDGLRALRKARA